LILDARAILKHTVYTNEHKLPWNKFISQLRKAFGDLAELGKVYKNDWKVDILMSATVQSDWLAAPRDFITADKAKPLAKRNYESFDDIVNLYTTFVNGQQ
jgi:hypothetical protein